MPANHIIKRNLNYKQTIVNLTLSLNLKISTEGIAV